MATQVGEIFYDVSFETKNLLAGQREVQKTLDQTGKAADGATASFGKLKAAALAVSSALAVQKVIGYADAWATAGNKLANATKAGETSAEVLERVFQSAQRTRVSIDAMATLYQRLEVASRSYGTSAEEVAQLSENVAKALKISGATTTEASSAMMQLGQAMGAGALQGEEFRAINENGGRIMLALADAMGVSRGALKALAADGKLTTEKLLELKNATTTLALDKEFAKTVALFSENLQKADNNITKFVGSSDLVKTGVAGLGKAFVVVSQNLDTVATAAGFAAAAIAGKLVSAIQTSAVEAIKSAVAANTKAQADLNAATGAARRAEADRVAALASFESAKAAEAAAIAANNAAKSNGHLTASQRQSAAAAVEQATAMRAAAMGEYAAATKAAASAQTTLTTATNAASASTRAMSAAAGLMRGAFALLGGPTGVVLIAAYAIWQWISAADAAKKKALEFGDQIDKLAGSYRELTKAQAAGKSAETARFIEAQKTAVAELDKELEKAKAGYQNLEKASASAYTQAAKSNALKNQQEAQRNIAILTADREAAQNKLNEALSLEKKLQAQAQTGPAAPEAKAQTPAADYLKNFADKQETAFAKIETARKAALDQVSADLKNSVISEETAAAARVKINTQADAEIAASRKKFSGTQDKFDVEGYLAGLRQATASEIEQAEISKNEKLRRLQELKIGEQDAATATMLIWAEYYQTLQGIREKDAQAKMASDADFNAMLEKNRAEAVAIAIQNDANEIARIQNQAALKIQELEAARQLDMQNEQIYADAITAINLKKDADIKASQDKLAKEKQAKSDAEVKMWSDGLGAMADMVKTFSGEQSKEYKAMFAASKAFAIADFAIKQGQAIAQAWSAGDYWTSAIRIAGAVAQGASILSGIQSANYSGRKYGGPVSAGQMYRVNETGAPEMFTAANGSQYMMPNASGQVTAANKIGGGVQVIIQNYAGAEVTATTSDDERIITVAVKKAVSEVADSLRSNTGAVWNAAKAGTNLQGRTA
jgi:tape measure domain-containing protein